MNKQSTPPTELLLCKASFILIAADTLERCGVPVEAFVDRTGASPRWLEAKPDMFIPLADVYRVFEAAGREIGGFGAFIHPDAAIGLSGQFGQIVRSGVTVYDALDRFCAHTPGLGGVHTHRLISDPARAGVWLARFGPLEAEGAVAEIELLALRFVIEIVRLAAGPHWRPLALRFRSLEAAQSAIEGVSALQGVPASTGVEWSGICIPKSVLALPMPPFEGAVAGEVAPGSVGRPGTRFEPALREILLSCSELGVDLSLQAVGETLGFHPRFLQRRLQSEGTTFQSVVDQARCLRARRLLLETDASLADIALQVGYSDQANFTRAYRRWTGSTPGALRREAQGRGHGTARGVFSRRRGDAISAA